MYYLLNFGTLWRHWKLLLLCIYVAFTWISIKQSSLPSLSCADTESHNNCVYPLVLSGDSLLMELWLFQKKQINNDTTTTNKNKRPHWMQINSCKLEFTIPTKSSILPQIPTYITNDRDNNCTFVLPKESRIRSSDGDQTKSLPLKGKLRFLQKVPNNDESTGAKFVREIPIIMTRIIKKKSSGKYEYVPHTKYSAQPLLIRFVVEEHTFGGSAPYYRNDGVLLKLYNRSRYRPLIYIDDNALRYSAAVQMSPPGKEAENKPALHIKIQVSFISPFRDVIIRQITTILNAAQSVLGKHEMDELRYWLRDEHLYRFILTQIIGAVHLWLSYMAFSDEIMFYRKKSNFAGVSTSSIVSIFVCRSIIFLYLMDGDRSSWIVLSSVFGDILVQIWKLFKLLRRRIVIQTKWPFVKICAGRNALEKETLKYDKVALFYLQAVLYPIVVCWSIYSLYYKAYRSLYSLVINCLVDIVYAFGFVSLCPQLYINYKLKSVSHLPWKVFLYKIFNTFVDDIFALLIEMPFKHRLMTLRDDVVFAILLYQCYLYRVDKSRTNEYGYSYAYHDEEKKEEKHNTEEHNVVGRIMKKDKDV